MGKNITPWGIQCKMQMVATGKSLTALSQETGFSRTYISAIINGRLAAPDDTIKTISSALKVDSALAR